MSEADPVPPEATSGSGDTLTQTAAAQLPTAAQWAEAQVLIEALKAELKDHQLRAMAELDNVRKRVARDSAQTAKFGAEKLMRDLLAIADSLELGTKAAVDATAQSVLEGVELTHRQLISVLEKYGVQIVDPAGQAFDPHLHEAVAVVESSTVPANYVVEVMQTGYLLYDRLLRPARVLVAKAPADAA